MASAKEHLLVGLIAGAAAEVFRSLALREPLSWSDVFWCGVGGVVGGLGPDVLEPATNPNHRNVAHSLVAGGVVTSAWRPLNDASTAPSWARAFGRGVVVGYISHLALDFTTPDGLPLLGR